MWGYRYCTSIKHVKSISRDSSHHCRISSYHSCIPVHFQKKWLYHTNIIIVVLIYMTPGIFNAFNQSHHIHHVYGFLISLISTAGLQYLLRFVWDITKLYLDNHFLDLRLISFVSHSYFIHHSEHTLCRCSSTIMIIIKFWKPWIKLLWMITILLFKCNFEHFCITSLTVA